MNIQQIKIHSLLLFKNKFIMIGTILLFVSTLGFLTMFMIMNYDISFIFYIICRFIFYESFIFILISFISLINAKKSKIDETISQISNHYYLKNTVITLLMLLIFYHLIIFVFLLLYAFIKNDVDVVFLYIINNYALNIIIPQLTWLTIIIIFTNFLTIKLSSLLFVITTLLFSPMMELFQWIIKPSLPIDQIVNYIHKPFSLFLQNANYSMDYLYGFQNEPYKVCVFFFWILLLLVLLMKKKLIKRTLYILLVLCLIGVYYPQNNYRINQKWDGTYYDYNYYLDSSPYTYTKYDYEIDNYRLDININTDLNVKGYIHLKSSDRNNEFIITLYNKYKIKDLSSQLLDTYTQKGDYIYLRFKEAINEADIYISYDGYHDVMFSNMQAVQLPGYFPWYPMSGQRNVYLDDPEIKTVHYGLNPYNRVNKAYFDVNIKAPYKVITNIENNKGYSDSLTLIGGNIGTYKNSNIQNYFLYKINSNYSVEYNEECIQSILFDTVDEIKLTFGIDYSHILDKKVIVCSKAIARTQINGRYAEFGDYIIITDDYYVGINDIVDYHILKNENIPKDIATKLLSINYQKPDENYYTIQVWKDVIFNDYKN